MTEYRRNLTRAIILASENSPGMADRSPKMTCSLIGPIASPITLNLLLLYLKTLHKGQHMILTYCPVDVSFDRDFLKHTEDRTWLFGKLSDVCARSIWVDRLWSHLQFWLQAAAATKLHAGLGRKMVWGPDWFCFEKEAKMRNHSLPSFDVSRLTAPMVEGNLTIRISQVFSCVCLSEHVFCPPSLAQNSKQSDWPKRHRLQMLRRVFVKLFRPEWICSDMTLRHIGEAHNGESEELVEGFYEFSRKQECGKGRTSACKLAREKHEPQEIRDEGIGLSPHAERVLRKMFRRFEIGPACWYHISRLVLRSTDSRRSLFMDPELK